MFHGTNKAGVEGITARGFEEKTGLSRNLTESLSDAKSYGRGKVQRGEPYYVIEINQTGDTVVHKYSYEGKLITTKETAMAKSKGWQGRKQK